MTSTRRHVERLVRAAASEAAVAFYERLVLALIVVNTAAVVLGTVDPLLNRYGAVFEAVEVVAVAAFTVEFVVRVGSRLVRPPDGSGRLRRFLDPHLAVDLLAILPFYAGLAMGVGGLGSSSLVRVLRLFKLARYFEGDDLLLGESGDDLIDGGTGNDTIFGAGGVDTFVFGPDFGDDVIRDFDPNGELIDLTALPPGFLMSIDCVSTAFFIVQPKNQRVTAK